MEITTPIYFMKITGCLSHKTDDWKTPTSLYKKFMDLNYYDPCPFQSKDNNLLIDWKDKNFVNPPYSKLKIWVNKCIEQHKKQKEVIMLIPARTDTIAFKMLYDYGAHFVFITGRLQFNDTDTAPFPSMLVNIIGGGKSSFELIERGKLL